MDEQGAGILRKRILQELERKIDLGLLVENVRQDQASRGMLNSGETAKRIAEVHRDAVRKRGEVIWSTMSEHLVNARVGYSEELMTQLKEITQSFFAHGLDSVTERLSHDLARADFRDMAVRFASELAYEERATLSLIESRLEQRILGMQAETLEAKPPDSLQNIKWLLLHGRKSWKLILVAVGVALFMFVLGVFARDLFEGILKGTGNPK